MSQPQSGGPEPNPNVQKFKAVFAELLSGVNTASKFSLRPRRCGGRPGRPSLELKARLAESETTGPIAQLKANRSGLEKKLDEVKADGVAGQNGLPQIKVLLANVQTASMPFGARRPEGVG